jgi:hypothetical protein
VTLHLLQTYEDLARLEAIYAAACELSDELFAYRHEGDAARDRWWHASISEEKACRELAEAQARMDAAEHKADVERGLAA